MIFNKKVKLSSRCLALLAISCSALLILAISGCSLKKESQIAGRTMGTTYHNKVVTGFFIRLEGLEEKIERTLNDAPAPEEIADLLPQVGFRHIRFQDGRTLSKQIVPLFVDLSSMAKGYGVDPVVRLLRGEGYQDFLVEIGGEVYASGRRKGGECWLWGSICLTKMPRWMPSTVWSSWRIKPLPPAAITATSFKPTASAIRIFLIPEPAIRFQTAWSAFPSWPMPVPWRTVWLPASRSWVLKKVLS